MPPRSIHDLLNRTPTPSPPSSPRQTGEQGLDDVPDMSDSSSSPPPTFDPVNNEELTRHPGNPRKRRSPEDTEQFVDSVSRAVRLKATSRGELHAFTKLSDAEQSVWFASRLLKINETIGSLQPPDAVYEIPSSLENRIERYAFVLLVSPTTSGYIKNSGPVKVILSHLESNPSWGLTPDVKADKIKHNIITTRLRLRLTYRRNEIKKAIKDSLASTPPMDIVTLCETIVALGERIVTVKISLQLAARVAFLRAVYRDQLGDHDSDRVEKYWDAVDSQLKEVRSKFVGEDSEHRTTQFFAAILKEDRASYGNPLMEGLSLLSAANPFADADGTN